MTFRGKDILKVLDQCAESFTFPMLDNGYIYPAAPRLSLLRSPQDWAMVIEVFGFSPRAILPDISVYTFASRLHNPPTPDRFVTREAYERYLKNNPNNEMGSAFPIAEGPWLDQEDGEFLAEHATTVAVRGTPISIPPANTFQQYKISPKYLPRVHVAELCRYLADIEREKILCATEERRINVPPEMEQILQLEEWHHPNLVIGERPSQVETFRQLADVLAKGDTKLYRHSEPPNTHWSNWPEAGTL